MKIAIVAPGWGRESTSDQIHLAALSRLLSERHAVHILTGPAGDGTSRGGALAVRPAGPVSAPGITVERFPASAGDRLPAWLAASALARPLVRWSLAPLLHDVVAWADALLVPEAFDALAQTVAYLAGSAGKLAALPSTTASTRVYAGALTYLAATRTAARHAIERGAPPDRVAITGLLPACDATADAAAFRRRYRVPGPFVLYDGTTGDAAYELLRNTAGLVRHQRPETAFVAVSPERGARKTTRNSQAGHMLHLTGLDDADRAGAIAAASVVCVTGPLSATAGTVADAWSRRRPVVAADAPAARELLADGAAGTVTPAAPIELAAGVLRLLADPAMADRLGAEGQRRLRDGHFHARLHDLLAERLAGGPSARAAALTRTLSLPSPAAIATAFPPLSPWQVSAPRAADGRMR